MNTALFDSSTALMHSIVLPILQMAVCSIPVTAMPPSDVNCKLIGPESWGLLSNCRQRLVFCVDLLHRSHLGGRFSMFDCALGLGVFNDSLDRLL